MLANDVLSVGRPLGFHLLGAVLDVVQALLGRDLQIQHVLTLLLLFFELFEHDFGLVSGRLDRMFQSHLHLLLGFGKFGSLISLSDTTSLNLILQLQVFFVSSSLLGEDVLNLRVAHRLLVLKILDAGLGDRDIDLHQVVLLASLISLLLSFLGQLTILQTLHLQEVVPAVVEDLCIELLNIRVQAVSLLLLFLL